MNSLVQIEIPKRKTVCAGQGEKLLPGMHVYSLIVEEQNKSTLARHDFCSSCWSQVKLKEGEYRGYWRSKIEQRKASGDSSLQLRALKLLREFVENPENKEEHIFILSLFLARAKIMALRQEFQQEGATYQLYEVLNQEEFFTIKMIQLSQLEIETLQKSLSEQLREH